MAKKSKGKKKGGKHAAWGAMPGMGPMPGGWGAGANGRADPNAPGVLLGSIPGLPDFMRTRTAEQFLIGVLVGAGAAWVLSDDKRRKAVLKSVMNLYAGAASGWEELKEQMRDIQEEAQAGMHAAP